MKSHDLLSIYQVSRHEFDLLASSKSRFVSVKTAAKQDALQLYQFIDDYLCCSGNKLQIIEDLISRNGQSVFLFEKQEQVVGFYALQMLNDFGLKALLLGEFDGARPDKLYLANGHQQISGLYVWAYIAPGLAANGVRHVSYILQQEKFRHINLYARPVTDEGVRVTLDFGFEPIEASSDGLYCYTRLVNRDRRFRQAA